MMRTQPGGRSWIPAMAVGSVLFWAAACSEQPTLGLDLDDQLRAGAHRVETQAHPMNAGALARRGGVVPMSGAIIDNGVIQLGVLREGHLGVQGGSLSSGRDPTTAVGVRYMPTNSDATAPGCICEGWGVADAVTGVWGGANVDVDGVVNLTVESFTATASAAVSVVRVGSTFRVTHHYRPSPLTPNMYEVRVSIENISAGAVDLRYRRVMDWDIAPNTFDEFVTVQGTAGATNVLFASNNGFASANPLSGPSHLGFTGDFVDAGPDDHGALFDFGFDMLAAGEAFEFLTFYGATADEASAVAALGLVGAEVYSFGQANTNNCNFDGSCPWTPAPHNGSPTGTVGHIEGMPHTFIFAFRGVGGAPVCIEIGLDQVWSTTTSPGTVSLSDADLFAAFFDIEHYLPRPNPASNVRIGDSWAEGTPAQSFALVDVNMDGNRDVVVRWTMSGVVGDGWLSPGPNTVQIWGQDDNTGQLFCSSGEITAVP